MISINKKTTKDQELFSVKVPRSVKTIDGKTVEILEYKGDFLLEDLMGRKRMLEKMIAEHNEELNELNEIITNINNYEETIKRK